MGTLLNRRRYMGVVPTPLPYDAEIEYLQSTNSQYIDTGYVPTLNTKAVVDFEVAASSVSNKNGFFGSRKDLLRFSCTSFTNGSKFAFAMTYNSWPSTTFAINANTRYMCSAENGKYSLNGTEYTTPVLGSFSTTENFLLFIVKTSTNQLVFNTLNYTAQRVYSCKIYESGVLRKDLIPVRVGTTGYMFDRITHTLYGNVGKGDFILGNDL